MQCISACHISSLGKVLRCEPLLDKVRILLHWLCLLRVTRLLLLFLRGRHNERTLVARIFMGDAVRGCMLIYMVLLDNGRICIEVIPLGLRRDNSGWIHLMQLVLVDVGVLDAMLSPVLQILEQLVKRMLDRRHHANTLMLVHVMVKSTSNCIGVVSGRGHIMMIGHMMSDIEVTPVDVVRSVQVSIVVHIVGFPVGMPVIGTVLDSMGVVMLIHMLWVVLTIVTVRVVVAEVMVALWLDVMILSMLFASEMSLVVKMRNMVLQLPIALLEMSIWVMFVAMD